MPNFSARPLGAGAAFGSSTDPTSAGSPLLPLGTPVETHDGRTFRWCKASSAADLVAGNTIQAPAFIVNHTALAVATAPIGATSFSVTPLGTGGAANLYAEGYMNVSVTAGLGYCYQISSHAAITASVAFTLNLVPSDGLIVALVAASSKVNLVQHPYNNVIQFPITTATNRCVGVAPYIISASQNGWLQTYGAACVLQKGTVGAGLAVGTPGSAAGACVAFAAATTQYIGEMLETGVDAVGAAVFLRIG